MIYRNLFALNTSERMRDLQYKLIRRQTFFVCEAGPGDTRQQMTSNICGTVDNTFHRCFFILFSLLKSMGGFSYERSITEYQ